MNSDFQQPKIALWNTIKDQIIVLTQTWGAWPPEILGIVGSLRPQTWEGPASRRPDGSDDPRLGPLRNRADGETPSLRGALTARA